MAALTIDQFLCLEETEPASEYACGEAFQMPDGPHAAIQTFLAVMKRRC